LGYGDPRVEAAAERQRQLGDTMTGPAPVFAELAEKFVAMVTHADWVMFAKNGTEGAAALADQGVSAEVLDLRTVVPLDEKGVLGSIAKTGRLVVVDESRDRCGLGSYVAAIAGDKGFASLKAPIKRVNIANVAIPYAPAAEAAVVPDAHKIGAAVLSILRH
jgi:pyruvate/2-oxoglutarate/acetoin dehydrogenase E1 component